MNNKRDTSKRGIKDSYVLNIFFFLICPNVLSFLVLIFLIFSTEEKGRKGKYWTHYKENLHPLQ